MRLPELLEWVVVVGLEFGPSPEPDCGPVESSHPGADPEPEYGLCGPVESSHPEPDLEPDPEPEYGPCGPVESSHPEPDPEPDLEPDPEPDPVSNCEAEM